MNHVSAPDYRDTAADIVRALTLYCLAEFQSGHATTIRITVEGSSFVVADNGRGHSIERTVEGVPYLKLIYTHFEYPFEPGQSAPVQLQGIGMSFINALCSELTVNVRKRDATLRMSFRNGRSSGSELVRVTSEETGTTVAGTVGSELQGSGVDCQGLLHWLLGLLAASPSLKLFFNGQELHSHPKTDA